MFDVLEAAVASGCSCLNWHTPVFLAVAPVCVQPEPDATGTAECWAPDENTEDDGA